MDYRIILVTLASLIGIAGTLPYAYHLIKGKIKPHVFSWIVWAILSSIAFLAQLAEGGGVGAWSTGVISALCGLIAIMALFKGGNTYITKTDWLCLLAAAIGIALWIATKNPLTAVVIVTLTDAIGFIPTFRKGYHKPDEENIGPYAAGTLQNFLAVLALEAYNPATVLYPASLVTTNTSFWLMILIRRMRKKL